MTRDKLAWADEPAAALRVHQHVRVAVDVDGENILTIETRMIAGKPAFTPAEEDAIRSASAQLIAFIGGGQ